MRKFFIMSLCLGLSSFMMSAQELTSEVAYKAYMDLCQESSLLHALNGTGPYHRISWKPCVWKKKQRLILN